MPWRIEFFLHGFLEKNSIFHRNGNCALNIPFTATRHFSREELRSLEQAVLFEAGETQRLEGYELLLLCDRIPYTILELADALTSGLSYHVAFVRRERVGLHFSGQRVTRSYTHFLKKFLLLLFAVRQFSQKVVAEQEQEGAQFNFRTFFTLYVYIKKLLFLAHFY